MSLFGSYIKEIHDKNIIEDEYGFATYFTAFNNEYMYIEDIYVVPEKRKDGCASKYADKIAEIAKEKGIKKLLGSVNLSIKNPTASTKVLLAYGFKILEADSTIIYFYKEL